MLGFCTSQALECTNFLQENSEAPPWWRAQGLGQTLLLSTNIQTRLHYFCCFCSSLHKNNQWWFPPEFSALPSWLISRFYSLKPCPFCWVKLGTFAQFLCSHIDVAAFPWQVKQFTNTCKQVCCKRRTRIFWWSKEKKKINAKNSDSFTGRLTLNELYLLINQRTRKLKGLKMTYLKTNYFMLSISV